LKNRNLRKSTNLPYYAFLMEQERKEEGKLNKKKAKNTFMIELDN